MADHKRLGRGLAALIGDIGDEQTPDESGRKPRRAPVEHLRANPRNPRRDFSDSELERLTDSIRERGLIQPVVVRPVRGQDDHYEIIAGERRWRAAQRAGLHDVPVVVVEATDAQALEFAIIENVQRADLNPIEEALGYQALMDEFSHNQEDIARFVGKSRSHVANTLRLLKLPEPVKALVQSGQLSAGHARILVGQPNAEKLAQQIVEQGLNVRQVEALAQQRTSSGDKKQRAHTGKSADTVALEKRLSDALGLVVSVDHRGGSGTLHIKYRDLDQLDNIIKKLDRR